MKRSDTRHTIFCRAIIALGAVALISPAINGERSRCGSKDSDQGGDFEVRFTLTWSVDELQFGTRGGFDTVRLPDCDVLTEPGQPGQPGLPAKTIRLALPAGIKATGAHVAGHERVELSGRYRIAPAPLPRPIAPPDGLPKAIDANQSRGAPARAPLEPVVLRGQSDLAGQSMAVLNVRPVQYDAATGRLELMTSMEIVVEGVGGHECGDYLPANASVHVRRSCQRMLRGMVINPDDAAPMARSAPAGEDGRGVEDGAYEYVIITDQDWVDEFQPLADWRTRLGRPAKIVTTDWIYNEGGYGGSNLEKIRAFIQDAHDTWGAVYFLYGADSDRIPYHTRTIEVPDYGVFDIANDTYCADYDDDWVCEVHLARASVHSPAQIATFIDKVFTYEKNPPADYVETAAFFGFDITTCGDQDGEIAKENIRAQHLPPAWMINTEYDDEPGTHRLDVIGYLNDGHHLVNHHDHCNRDCMGTGWICHGELIYNSDVQNLHNGDRLSIVFAVGCYPALFPFYACIGETFLLHDAGGAVAFLGNTSIGWGGGPEDPDWYTVRQDRFLYRNLFDDGFERLGASFSDLKNDEFSFEDPYNLHQFCFTQLHLLSEPELAMWSQEPGTLTVMHDETLPAGEATSFAVEVLDEGVPLDGATVCLWKGEEIYEVGETVNGVATFEVEPPSTGTMLVTASEHDYLPYEGQAEVVGNDCPEDLNGDGVVNTADLLTLLANWGTNGAGDINNDGVVNTADLLMLLAAWGECP
jgi:hypothetical protein